MDVLHRRCYTSEDLRELSRHSTHWSRTGWLSPSTKKTGPSLLLSVRQWRSFPQILPYGTPLNVKASAHVQNKDLPVPPPRNKKKPFVRPPRRGGFLSRKAKTLPRLRNLRPPGNGLLVQKLVPVAQKVFEARSKVIRLIGKLMEVVPVKVCKFCGEVHIGPVGHLLPTCNGPAYNTRRSRHAWVAGSIDDVFVYQDTFHLYDRLRTIYHEGRFQADRIPALVELCIQAGVDITQYPTLRRKRGVQKIGKRIIERDEPLFEIDDDEDEDDEDGDENVLEDAMDERNLQEECTALSQQMESSLVANSDNMASLSSKEIALVAEETLEAWLSMRRGAKLLMRRYPVRVCGYCPEVHVGPRGHKVKLCGAFKHQWRQGQHGWQEATIDDLISPNYVWHVKDLQAPLLVSEFRKYYGKTPAVVELCVQAGAAIPEEYKPLMRVDVVTPDIEELRHVV